jgi:hypothetical protein
VEEGAPAPAVVSLNGIIAFLAVTEFIVGVTGIRKPDPYLFTTDQSEPFALAGAHELIAITVFPFEKPPIVRAFSDTWQPFLNEVLLSRLKPRGLIECSDMKMR